MTTPRALRNYQSEAVSKVKHQWTNGNTRTVIVHATGLGKTDIIAKLATAEVANGGRALLIAHRSEPLDQMTERCKMYGPRSLTIGRIQAGQNEMTQQILVASVQTVSRTKRLEQLPKITLVIIDETHHALSQSYLRILQHVGAFDPQVKTRVLGVTATLVRGDHRGFGKLFQSVADVKDIDWAVKHHWLVKPWGRSIIIPELRTKDAKTSRGDYVDRETGEMVSAGARKIVQKWQRYASDRITVVFTPTRTAAADVLAAFHAQSIPAEMVLGTTPHEDRQLIYKRLATSETRVLVSVMVTTEAWDCPPVSCVLIARPTQLPGLYAQMAGRGLRLAEGKRDCLILDVVGIECDPRLVTLADMYPSALYIDGHPVVLGRYQTARQYAYRARKVSIWSKALKYFRRRP